MNINDSSAIRLCTSCQMCAAVCPKHIINISLDINGFYRPTVEVDSCIDCGLCVKVCYKFDTSIEDFDSKKLATTTLYAASAKDKTTLSKTTSGGIADLLARKFIASGS